MLDPGLPPELCRNVLALLIVLKGVDYRAVKPVGILAAHEPTKA